MFAKSGIEVDGVSTDYFPDFIPLHEILWDNCTIATKDLSICQTVRLTGIDYQGLSSDQIEALHALRSAFFADEDLAGKVTIGFFTRRRQVSYDDRTFANSNALVSDIARTHLEQFTGGFITELTMVVSMKLGKIVTGITGVPSEDFKQENQRLKQKVEELSLCVHRIAERLKVYGPEVLRHQANGKSPLLDFWMYNINAGAYAITPHQTSQLADNCCVADVYFEPKKRTTTFTDRHGNKRYAAFLALKTYPSETNAVMMDALMQLQHEIQLVQYFTPQDKEKTKGQIERKIKMLFGGIAFASGRINELDDAANRMDTDNICFHKHVCFICVYGDSEADLHKAVHDIEAALSPWGIALIRESINMMASFFALFPDRAGGLSVRQRLITQHNLAQFITLAGAHEGHRRSAFGHTSVAPFRRPDGSVYHFNWHPDPLPESSGHTFVCGAPGSGKSTLMMFLIMMSLDLKGLNNEGPLKALIFDSQKGVKIPTLALDGIYHTLGEDNQIDLNPFSLPDTPENKAFLERFIALLADNQVTEQEKQHISHVIWQAYELGDHQTRLCDISTLFGSRHASANGGVPLASKMEKWLPSSEDGTESHFRNGMIFNAKTDALNFDKPLVGFDMTHVLKDTELLAPLTSYLFHKFNNTINASPCPHIVFIDECKQYLEHPLFGEHLLKILREQRRRKGILVMAGQEPGILTQSERGRDALQNMETFLIWPNASASAEDYIDGLGLTDREYGFIKEPSGLYQVLVKRKNGGSVILDVDLSHLGDYLNIFHSSINKVKRLEQLMGQYPDNWLKHYLGKAVTVREVV